MCPHRPFPKSMNKPTLKEPALTSSSSYAVQFLQVPHDINTTKGIQAQSCFGAKTITTALLAKITMSSTRSQLGLKLWDMGKRKCVAHVCTLEQVFCFWCSIPLLGDNRQKTV